MQITVQDKQTYKITQREVTDEGFLRVPGKVSRTGIQEYLASELGLTDRNPNDIVRVYRPYEEVFSPDSLASFDGVSITLQHPDALVNSKNYSQVTKGIVRGSGTETDDQHVQCNLLIQAQDAIDAVQRGMCELSAGYTALYDDTPGVTPDGQDYDFKQTRIHINHVAIVDRGRAGTARIFDNKTGGISMPVLIVTDSGRSIDVADTANAQLVADAFDRANKRATDAEAARDSAQALYDAAQEQLAELKLKASDEAIKARLESIAQVTSVARKIAGDTFSCDSLDTVSIMRAALAVKRPKLAWGDKSAAYVEAAFDAEAEKEDEDEEDTKDAGGNGKQRKSSGDAQYQQLATDAAKVQKTSDDMLNERKRNLSNAWKGAK